MSYKPELRDQEIYSEILEVNNVINFWSFNTSQIIFKTDQEIYHLVFFSKNQPMNWYAIVSSVDLLLNQFPWVWMLLVLYIN